MEVHHHPHVEKKSFKEYLLEGLMIFLAVTMGFFAESLRENLNKHEREHHLMEMLVEDLKKDLPQLDTTILKDSIKMTQIDTLRLLASNATVTTLSNDDYKRMYYLYRYVNFTKYFFVATQRTILQFEKNDGFGLIQKQSVSDSINNYYRFNSLNISVQQTLHNEALYDAYKIGQTIFDIRILNDYLTKESAFLILQSNRQFNLLTKDTNTLLLYASNLFTARGTLLLNINMLRTEKNKAKKLIELIQKEYHLENK